jgi:hypothetical protein
MNKLSNENELTLSEIATISGGHKQEESFWYMVGEFFAHQANANDAIYRDHGRTNMNNYF